MSYSSTLIVVVFQRMDVYLSNFLALLETRF